MKIDIAKKDLITFRDLVADAVKVEMREYTLYRQVQMRVGRKVLDKLNRAVVKAFGHEE